MDIFLDHPELLKRPDRLSITLQFLAVKFLHRQEHLHQQEKRLGLSPNFRDSLRMP